MKKKLEKNRYSVSKILREKNRSNDFFEIMLGNLTLEEIISLKLEIRIKKANSSINTPNMCAINEGTSILLELIIFN